MKLFNKGQRAIIIFRHNALSGCRFPTDEMQKDKAYFDPDTQADITDSVAEKLLKDYPRELMKIGEGSRRPVKRARKAVSRRKDKVTA